MVTALTEHEIAIEKKMEILSQSLKAIKAFKADVMQMKTMDFRKFAAIHATLQMKGANY